MKNNKNAETLVGIIIGLIIFSIIALGIIGIVSFNKEIIAEFEDANFENILKNNSDVILRKLNLNGIIENESFFIYKNNNTKNFEILTGVTNSHYKYIDLKGEKVDNINNPNLKVFKREFNLKKDIVKYSKKPSEIDNLILHFDGQDINGDLNNSNNPSNNSSILEWTDKSGKVHNANQSIESYKPTIKTGTINGFDGLRFDGVDDYLEINSHDDLNTSGTGYIEKSFAIVFKTGTGLLSGIQSLYQEGNDGNSYSIFIENGLFKGKILGSINNELTLGNVEQNSIYSIIITQSSNSTNTNYNSFYVYLNGNLVNYINNIENQTSHTGTIFIGKGESGQNFNGYIGEVISWNYYLNKNDIEGINNYFKNKWFSSLSTNINGVITNINKYNPN